ncbi:MAG TPA: DUF4126 domain-containing protein, partial [Terrabacter sp.]|nr:DUF4126 domain-containing protein [Terrabacter sp.]
VLLAAGAFLVYKVAGRIRRLKRRYDVWGERVGIASPGRRRSPDPSAPLPPRRRRVGADEVPDTPFDQEA